MPAWLQGSQQPNLLRLYRDSLRRINSLTNRQLFVTGLPRLETVRQGRIGDCFCLAPIGAMVHRNPQEVAAMFSMQGEYHCAVKIGSEFVMVPLPTDAERAMGRMANSHDGLWVELYEKAISQIYNNRKPPSEQLDSSLETIASGGGAGRIISELTGHKISGFALQFAQDPAAPAAWRDATLAALRGKLADASAQKRLMTCSTLTPATPGVTPHHVYAVLEYDPINDTIDLWNPHGNEFAPQGPPGLAYGYPTHNGVFTVPVPEFAQLFSGMAFEDPEVSARE